MNRHRLRTRALVGSLFTISILSVCAANPAVAEEELTYTVDVQTEGTAVVFDLARSGGSAQMGAPASLTDGRLTFSVADGRDKVIASARSLSRPEAMQPVPDSTWASGVYVPGSTPQEYADFAAWRGRPNDVVVDWPARHDWDDIVSPDWLYDAWEGTAPTKVFGVAMLPEGDSSATLATCARGDHDAQWREFGANIAARGLDDETIVRLGWESNGNWYKWSATDPQAWVACWQRIVSNAEQTAPALRWDWTVNRGPGQSVRDASSIYPGDAYVDIVGVDSYDMWPPATSEESWQSGQYGGEFGLRYWRDFAVARGKKLSVPEWGVYPGTAHAGHNGGDNAFYIQKMVEFFRANSAVLAYEAYFNEPASYYAGSLFAPAQNPVAASAYALLY